MPASDPSPWYAFDGIDTLPSPALLIYPERVRANIQRMLATAGDPKRLQPHIKTAKMPGVVRCYLEAGITRFKCATIAEAEMLAQEGARNILLSYPLIGPNPERLAQLVNHYPRAEFSTIADSPTGIARLSDAFPTHPSAIGVLLDIDCGMHRTGVSPDTATAEPLYRQIHDAPGLQAAGLHVYDGHLRQADPAERRAASDAALEPVLALKAHLEAAGLAVPQLVAGGTPTFPIHASHPDRICSPGTCIFWDAGYAKKLPDMAFDVAALVLTRVVSKPGGNRLCLDLGHKAIASENPHPRVIFLNLESYHAVSHSEEHLVIETPEADRFQVGDSLHGIPWHICPTVALFAEATTIENVRPQATWSIPARNRKLRY